MGIESDQVVYEYLSRVGDLAQQQQLPSAARVRLVTELRNEIDRRRSKTPVDSPASVRRIIARLGTPDEVVAAAGAPDAAPEEPRATVPGPRPAEPRERTDEPRKQPREPQDRPKGLRRIVPRPRPAEPRPAKAPADGPATPRADGPDGPGNGATPTDWWRVDGAAEGGPGAGPRTGSRTGPRTPGPGDSPFAGLDLGPGDSVPGFVGGVEIPELLKPRPPWEEDEADEDGAGGGREQGKKAAEAPNGAAPGQKGTAVTVEKAAPVSAVKRVRGLVPRLRPGKGWNNPLLLLAAALLVAGAFVGSLVPLILGWLIAYLSRRLSPNESKWAVLGVPGAVAAAGIVWLWGRMDGRWGEPIAEGQLGDAIAGTWPWVLRGAAVASAAYLVWRSQRPR